MSRLNTATERVPTVLIDAGPLVALIDLDDANYQRAITALRTLPKAPLLTVWPCFTEAMYLLGRSGGYPAQKQLLNFLSTGAVRLWYPDALNAATLETRITELIETYRDTPCDFADATLVAAAEITQIQSVFTFDRHFYAYRIANGSALQVVPSY